MVLIKRKFGTLSVISMKNLPERITLRSALNIFDEESGYIKLTDESSKGTLFFKEGRLSLAIYRPLKGYSFTTGEDAVKKLEERTFFTPFVRAADKKFVSSMEKHFPEASAELDREIQYPCEEKMDLVLDNVERKEEIKKETIEFLEEFISEHINDIPYIEDFEIGTELREHLNSVFSDLEINEEFYNIAQELLDTLPQKNIREEFHNELSKTIQTEGKLDGEFKEETTSMISNVAIEYIKSIKESAKTKKKVKERSIEYFSKVINNHLKETKNLTPFERGVHLKEIVLRKPIGDIEPSVKEHLKILKEKFIKRLDLIKRCHLCGKQIEEGFLCEECEGEYREYREKRKKIKSLVEKIKRLYIRGKIDEEEYKYLFSSAKEKMRLIQESERNFESLKEYINL